MPLPASQPACTGAVCHVLIRRSSNQPLRNHPMRSLNSSLNLLNKWSLGVYGFRFPFLLTSCAPCLPRCTCTVCQVVLVRSQPVRWQTR